MNKHKVFLLLFLLTAILLIGETAGAASLGSRSLSLGAEGSDVRELQRLLAVNGFFAGPQSGTFGPLTQQAVISYQRSRGLPTIGVVGPRTSASLLSQRQAYTVARGDTLIGIARRHGTTVTQLKQVNNLRNDMIVAGRRLFITTTAASVNNAPLVKRISITPEERATLARLVHAEAQGESFAGQVAVAAVVLNRISDPRFPDTIREVLYQPFQFEPVLNGWVYKPAGPDAYRAVDAALAGQDPSRGAVFFYNPTKAPHTWMATRPVILRIGNHVFMR